MINVSFEWLIYKTFFKKKMIPIKSHFHFRNSQNMTLTILIISNTFIELIRILSFEIYQSADIQVYQYQKEVFL